MTGVDVYRTNMQVERFLMTLGYDLSEPPDDRKTFDDMFRYPRRDLCIPEESEIEGELIAEITFDHKNQTVMYFFPLTGKKIIR